MPIKVNFTTVYNHYRSARHIGAVGRAIQTARNDVNAEPITVSNTLQMQTNTKMIRPGEKRYPWLIKLEERYFCEVNTPQTF